MKCGLAGIRPVEATVRIGASDVLVLGTVAGAGQDGERVAEAIDAFGPEAIALGIPEEDLPALATLVADPSTAEELPEVEGPEALFLEELARFGDVLVAPSPDLAAAERSGLALHAVDLDDHAHTELYTASVKVRHLVQRASARTKATKMDWSTVADRFALAQQWDAILSKPKPIKAIEVAREVHMAERIEDLARDHGRLLAVVPAARFEGVVSRLRTDGA